MKNLLNKHQYSLIKTEVNNNNFYYIQNIIILGAGSLPLSAICYYEKYRKAQFHCIDNNSNCVNKGDDFLMKIAPEMNYTYQYLNAIDLTIKPNTLVIFSIAIQNKIGIIRKIEASQNNTICIVRFSKNSQSTAPNNQKLMHYIQSNKIGEVIYDSSFAEKSITFLVRKKL